MREPNDLRGNLRESQARKPQFGEAVLRVKLSEYFVHAQALAQRNHSIIIRSHLSFSPTPARCSFRFFATLHPVSQPQLASFNVTRASYHMRADRSNNNRDVRPAVTTSGLASICDGGSAVTPPKKRDAEKLSHLATWWLYVTLLPGSSSVKTT